jgi:hypothetical protein
MMELTASKGILIWCASVVCYLYPAALPYGIVVEVDIGAFVEAVVRGLLVWWGDVVVDVCEAAFGQYVFSRVGMQHSQRQ